MSEKLCHFRNIVLNRWEGGLVSKILVGQNENLSSFPSTQLKAELISPCLSLQHGESRVGAPGGVLARQKWGSRDGVILAWGSGNGVILAWGSKNGVIPAWGSGNGVIPAGEAETELPEASWPGSVTESVNYRLSGRLLLKKQCGKWLERHSVLTSILQLHVHTFMDPLPTKPHEIHEWNHRNHLGDLGYGLEEQHDRIVSAETAEMSGNLKAGWNPIKRRHVEIIQAKGPDLDVWQSAAEWGSYEEADIWVAGGRRFSWRRVLFNCDTEYSFARPFSNQHEGKGNSCCFPNTIRKTKCERCYR